MSDIEQGYDVLRFLAVLSGLDLIVRGLANLFFTGELVEIAVGTVLISQLVIDSGTLGWAFGWVVLGAAVFLVSPRVFPQQLVTWARGIPGRTALMIGSIGVGIYISWFLGTLSQFSTSQITLQGWMLLALLSGIVVLLRLSFEFPAWCPDVWLLRSDWESPLTVAGEIKTGEAVARLLLIVTLAGVFLALVSRLFPLPEIILIGLALWHGVLRLLGPAGGVVTGRRDIAERFLVGLSAVWLGPDAILAVIYAALPTFLILYFDVGVLRLMEEPSVQLANPVAVGSVLVTNPLQVSFIALTLGAATLSVVVASVRLIESVPTTFVTDYVESGATVTEQIGDPQNVIPGFNFFPAILLVLWASVAPQSLAGNLSLTWTGETTTFTLSVSPIAVGLASFVATLSILSIVVSRRIRLTTLSVYHYAVVSAVVFCSVALGYGAALDASVDPAVSPAVPPPPLKILAAMGVFFVLSISPFAGFELFDTRETRGGDEVSTFGRLAGELKLAIYTMVGVVVAMGALEMGESRVPEILIVRQVVGWLSIPIIVGGVYRVVLLPFYYLEKKL